MTNKYADIQKKLKKEKSLIYYDIETSPMKVYIWHLGEQNVNHEQIIEETKIISISYMYEGCKLESLTWDKNQNDKDMLEKFCAVMSTAKVAITQNGKAFDNPLVQWRLNVLGLSPLKSVEMLDILQLSRSTFEPPSHKLDYRAKVYGGGKIEMHLKDWINVLENKPGALDKMVQYNKRDVLEMRKVFWRELPFYKSMPVSLSAIIYPNEVKTKNYCNKCASGRQRRFDVYPTKIGNKTMMQCDRCGNLWKDTGTLKISASQ